MVEIFTFLVFYPVLSPEATMVYSPRPSMVNKWSPIQMNKKGILEISLTATERKFMYLQLLAAVEVAEILLAKISL